MLCLMLLNVLSSRCFLAITGHDFYLTMFHGHDFSREICYVCYNHDFLRDTHARFPASYNHDFFRDTHARFPASYSHDFFRDTHVRFPASYSHDFFRDTHVRFPASYSHDFFRDTHKSMLGRKSLETQLHQIGILQRSQNISQNKNFNNLLKILWANHGDEISIQYSGTPALKGDFVRYGQRSIQGILADGHHALARYYFNNFCDGAKQDAIDLLQGNYIVSREIKSPFQARGLEAVASFPLASVLIVAGIMLSTMSLRQAKQDARRFLFSAFWVSLALGIMTFVRINGRLFCNRPRLQKLL